MYALGCGLAHYLGYAIQWYGYWIGQVFILCTQLAGYYLKLYFELHGQLNNIKVNSRSTDSSLPRWGKLTKNRLLSVIYSLLTVGAMFVVLLLTQGHKSISLILIVVISLLFTFFYGVPPFRLIYSGYGELSQAILLANLVPAFSFIIQTGQLHRLLAMMTFPVTMLFIAMVLALSLVSYASDIKNEHKTLMVRIGWQYGMYVHNLLILVAYLIFILAFALGLPWSLTWPGLLTIPVAAYQVHQISQIAGGAKPRWKILEYTSLSTLMLTAYFLTLAIWTR